MANTVKSRVVEISRQGVDTTLEDYLSLHTYPVETFMTGSTDLKTAVATGIIYLKSVGTGSIVVSKTEERDFLIARVITNPDNTVSVNYVAKNYRFPINEEKVPIIDVSWGVGDIILNTDYTQNQCMGWVCKESGVPGVWNQFGNIGPYYNFIEELDYLPEPSELQVGRQVRYRLNGKQGLFICRWDGTKAVWAQQDYLIGPEEERPESAPNGTWYYNTTVDRYEWYSERDSHWYRFEQMESEFAKWSKQVDDTIVYVKEKADEDVTAAINRLENEVKTNTDKLIEESTKKIDDTISKANTDVGNLISNTNKTVNDTVSKANTDVENLITNTNNTVNDTISQANTDVEALITASTKKIDDTVSKANTDVESLITNSTKKIDDTISKANTDVESLITNSTKKIDDTISKANTDVESLITEGNTKVDSLISDNQNRIDEVIQSCVDASNNANNSAQTVESLKESVNRTIKESIMIWKPVVASYDEIATTYPNPEQGWTVNTQDTGDTYRYNADEGQWVRVMVTPTNVLTKSEATGMFQKKFEYVNANLTITWPNTVTLSEDTTTDDFIEVFLDPSATEDVKIEYSDLGIVASLTDSRTITFTYTENVNTQEIPIIVRISRV